MSKAGVGLRKSAEAAATVAEVKREKRGWSMEARLRNNFRTAESFREEVAELGGGEYQVIEDYITARIKVTLLHSVCGYKWNTRARGFVINGTRCPKCAGFAKKSSEEYANELRDVCGKDYSVIEEYKGLNNFIKHRHNTCGHIWKVRPANVLKSGGNCPKCSNEERTMSYVARIFSLYGDEYSLIGNYDTILKLARHRHNKCGYEWELIPDNLARGLSRCPRCSESKGETQIADTLTELEVKFTREYRIKNCRAKRTLPFDFAIITSRNPILIEYDGEQHSKAVEHWGGQKTYEYVRRNDRIKTEYCRANDIPLIRIDYKDFDNIETILTEELTKLGVIGKRFNDGNATESEREVSAC